MWHQLIALLGYTGHCRYSYASLFLVSKAVHIPAVCPSTDLSSQDFLESCNLSAPTITHPSAEPLPETSSWPGYPFSQSFESLITFQASTRLQNLAEIFHITNMRGQLLLGGKAREKGKVLAILIHMKSALKKKKGKRNNKIQLSSIPNTLYKTCNVYAKEVKQALPYIIR